jgi:hypothetical protein
LNMLKYCPLGNQRGWLKISLYMSTWQPFACICKYLQRCILAALSHDPATYLPTPRHKTERNVF